MGQRTMDHLQVDKVTVGMNLICAAVRKTRVVCLFAGGPLPVPPIPQ